MNAITEFLLARIAEDEVRSDGMLDRLTWARRLRESAAKRAIIGSWQSCTAMTAKEQEPGTKLVGAGMVQGLDVAMKSLAAVYSDHPDYNPDWAL